MVVVQSHPGCPRNFAGRGWMAHQVVVSTQLQFPQYLGWFDGQEYINKGSYKISEILLVEEGKR